MTRLFRTGTLALLWLALSISASAQTAPRPDDWRHATTLNVFAGAGAASSDTRPLGGTSIGWEATPRMSLEGSGYWFDRGAQADAYAAALKLQVGLLAPSAAVPFVEAGMGLYRARFDSAARSIPDFYRRRMGTVEAKTMTTFTDPSFILGGGLNVFVTRHIGVRPDVEMMIVRRDAHNYFVTAVAVHMAYRFDGHSGQSLR